MMSSTTPRNFPDRGNIIRGYRPQIEQFTGGYINNIPEIEVFDRNDKVVGILLATDGLWDELKRPDVLNVYRRVNMNNPKAFLSGLVDSVLEKAADSKQVKTDDLRAMALGHRRSYHDDISIIYADLSK
jgi:serine/threonine protein phosphatase PrpC